MTSFGESGRRGPGYTQAAGFGPNGQSPRAQPPATPPQWRQDAPPRQDPRPVPWYQPRPAPQPGFTPAYGSVRPEPPRRPHPQDPAWADTGPQPRHAPQQQHTPAPQHAQSRRPGKRRVFLWVFLAVQALFLVWLITGIAGTSHSGTDAHTQAAQFCSVKSNWQFLYKSQADCVTRYGNTLNGASDVGKGLGAVAIIAFWVVTDFFLALGYGVYRLASRR